MKTEFTTRMRLPVAVSAMVLIGGSLTAQAPTKAVSLVGGPAPYDLAGTGTGVTVGTRGEWRPLQHLGIQVGVSYFKYVAASQVGYDYLLPEVTVLGRIPLGPVGLFLGAGVGASIELEGQDDEALTLHAALGANVAVSRRIETVTEARLRSIDPWTGNTVDLLIGLGWLF